MKRKLGKNSGGGWDTHYGNRQLHHEASRNLGSSRQNGKLKNILCRELKTGIARINRTWEQLEDRAQK